MAREQQVSGLAPLSARDRALLWGALGLIVLLAWAYLARISAMEGRSAEAMGMAMPMAHRWTAEQGWLTFVMWVVMMVAMMLPSASPMLTMFARITAGRGQAPWVRLAAFALGYVAVWAAFSAVATAAQAGFESLSMLSGSMRATPLLGATILAAAGIYQLTPLKNACLARCRSPIGFFMTEWREGPRGALVMGIRHGIYCLGCCWMLMALLLVAGVMNLLWVAALAVFVLLEKTSPFEKTIATASGLAFIAWGLLLALL
jgi:predicted metal-binding membrane protein